MLRRVRNKLRMIRYHSAARARTAWTRAFDMAFVGSFLLAFPAAWLCDAIAIRPTIALSVPGQFFRDETSVGTFTAALLMPQAPRAGGGRGFPNSTPHGSFLLVVEERAHGWPLTTSVHRLPARVAIDIPSEKGPRTHALLPVDGPLREALERGLEEDGHDQALAALRSDSTQVRQKWISWPIASGLWWIMMAFGSSFALGIAKYVTQVFRGAQAARRGQLRAEGKCAACGYDMTGLEFNERCPECGNIVW